MPRKQFKRCLITGASTGLGAGLALEFAAPGVELFLTCYRTGGLNDTATACRNKGAVVHECYVDVRSKDDMAQLLDEANKIAPLDLVVANAGICTREDGLEETVDILQTNVIGTANTVVPAIQHMIRHHQSRGGGEGGGQIVLMSSLGGLIASNNMFMTAYVTSKVAIRVYGQSLRTTLASHGIGVTVILPGMTESRMVEEQQAKGIHMVTGVWPLARASRVMAEGIRINQAEIAWPSFFYVLSSVVGTLPQWLMDITPTSMLRFDPYLQYDLKHGWASGASSKKKGT